MNSLFRSDEFRQWLAELSDISAEHGNFGDYRVLDEGVCEMRIDFGPGYRVYYTRRGQRVYFLLIGGDKSTQREDIKRAVQMARELKD